MDDARHRETVAARTLRQLSEATPSSRPRVEADVSDPDIPVAATVLLVRDGAAGPEVLLLERPDRGSFAGAWVFPGGKIDPEDADALPADASEEAVARVAAVRETREETGLELDGASLVTISWWDPPPGLPLRIRTWFFVARAPDGELVLQENEAVASMWARPEDVLRGHGRGEYTLYPPTWVTLYGVGDQPTVDSVLAEARLAGVRIFESQFRQQRSGAVFFWQEDAEYHGQMPSESSARHRMEVGALPWIYTRTP